MTTIGSSTHRHHIQPPAPAPQASPTTVGPTTVGPTQVAPTQVPLAPPPRRVDPSQGASAPALERQQLEQRQQQQLLARNIQWIPLSGPPSYADRVAGGKDTGFYQKDNGQWYMLRYK